MRQHQRGQVQPEPYKHRYIIPRDPAEREEEILMKSILSDIKTAVSMFREVRKDRSSGSGIRVQQVKEYPVLTTCGILSTVEGCALINGNSEIFCIAQQVFNKHPYEERHRLAFSPQNGEFTERVRFWRELLRPVLSEKQCHEAMQTIIRWYIHIKRNRLDQAA